MVCLLVRLLVRGRGHPANHAASMRLRQARNILQISRSGLERD
jgi:hypothetical protein